MKRSAALADVEALLREENVKVVAHGDDRTALLVTTFEVERRAVPVLALLNGAGDYLLMVGIVEGATQDGKPATLSASTHLDRISADKLRAIVRAQASAPLAKAEFIGAGNGGASGVWAAVSYCSTQGMTGLKLRKRLEDCAKLAEHLGRLLGSE